MHIDGAFVDIDVAAPDAVEKLRPAEHAARALHEELEQAELGGTKVHLPSVPRHSVRVTIKLDVANAQYRGDALGVGAPEDRSHPSHQLRQGERLDHVIVGAGGQSPDAIALFAARGEKNNGNGTAVFAGPEPTAKLEPGEARQHPVENDQVGRAFRNRNLGFIAAVDDIDGIAFSFEVVAEEKRQRLFVLNDQDLGSWAHGVHLEHGLPRRPLQRDRRRARGVALGTLIGDRSAVHQVINGLGDIGGVVADPLNVLGTEQEVGAKPDVTRVLHHVGEKLAEQRVVHGVDLFVLVPDLERPVGVALDEGVKNFFQLTERKLAHVFQPERELLRLLLAHHGDRALGDVLAEIADALELVRDAERRHDLSEVIRQGLPARDHHHRLLLNLLLQRVDRLIFVDGGGSKFGIAALQRVEGLAEYLLGETAHLGDLVVEEGELLLIRPDDVFVLLLHSVGLLARKSSRSGR